ncbi:phosphoribosyl-ATP diphosphatase [Feifania hominis]|uniref:Phosphoribosyl-ATP pyrophosphatase n=1 Tax=Feifania hominis TaxID=2763660 RepID=A0A926HTU1_9FIRM|nr:phosphoribosyl-ATP diphosphatase [Feifania hominis]MBC8536209.1 phosphoribosyl-ATP diphosphatase [Feifania hominis]
MNGAVQGLYEIIRARRGERTQGSYTCYLFEQGLDKILKKVGEEASECIIAAKNGDGAQTAQELCDLIYHLLVLMVEQDIPLDAVEEILEQRRRKQGNLKEFHQVDRNS